MSQQEGNKYHIESRTVVTDEDMNVARAAGVVQLMLGMWRARFTEGAVGGQVRAEYEDDAYGSMKIESADPSKVQLVNQGTDGLRTTYEFDADIGRLLVDVVAPDDRQPQPPHAPVFLFEHLSRLLFEADEHEALGR